MTTGEGAFGHGSAHDSRHGRATHQRVTRTAQARAFSWAPPCPLSSCVAHRRANPAGVIGTTRSRTASPWVFEAVLEDGSGSLVLVFLGRRAVPGLVPGARLQVEGMVGERRGELVMVNPRYRFTA